MSRTIVRAGLVLVTLLAIALGGSVDLPAQTILAALAGLFLIVAPPQAPVPRVPLLFAGFLLLIALLAFLPAGSAAGTPWRNYLITECNIPAQVDLGGHLPVQSGYDFPLENTRSPQPWLTLQGCGLLFLGLTWGLYLITLPWEREDRVLAAELLVFGVALLALLAVLAYALNFQVPGWVQEQNRGWFPNRNQTADVLALTGIVGYALIFDRLRKGKRIGYLLLTTIPPIVTLLVISLSRAGILLFFGGLLAWHLWPRSGGGRRRGTSFKWIALSLSLGIVLLALFLAWGGETLARFQAASPVGADFTDFRGAIQQDAFFLSLQSPILGAGLGNFQPLFAFSRAASINGSSAIHPESDWLWLACEMGWPAVAVLVAGYVWWVRRALPLENKAGESVRRALIVAVLVFGVHGLVDVSGHRLGSLWVALLLAGMALPVRARERASAATPLLFRGLGLALLALAGWWGASLHGLSVPPTTATLVSLTVNAGPARTDLPGALASASTALRIAPLDWSLYFLRGELEAIEGSNLDAAEGDFATARALNPYWTSLPVEEGTVWMDVHEPDLASDAWRDGLHRAGPMALTEFTEMIARAPEHSIVRQDLAGLAFNRDDFLLALLPTSGPLEAQSLIGNLQQSDPELHDLNAKQRAQLFASWWKSGDPVSLMMLAHDHPEWDEQTWLYQARFKAEQNDLHGACDLAAHWVRRPMVPQISNHQPLGDLAAAFKGNPGDLTAGLELLFAQIDEGQNDDALATIGTLLKMPVHPAYLPYLAAQLETEKGDWAAAWNAWQEYLTP